MKYTVYKTTNLINNKIYIGCHATENANDDYLGSGKLIQAAIKKHGKENFLKEVLFEFDNREEMLAKEKELVNEQFVTSTETYNLKIGGEGGWDHINSAPMSNDHRSSIRTGVISYYQKNPGINNGRAPSSGFTGKRHSLESKKKISENNGSNLSSSVIKSRIRDFQEIDKSWGHMTKLANKWNISHTQARRFIKKYIKQ